MKVTSEVEIFICLKLKTEEGNSRAKTGIGFEIYEFPDEQMVTSKFNNKSTGIKNDGGYIVSSSVTYDGRITHTPRNKHFVLFVSTFDPQVEAEFTLKLYYKKRQGKVSMKRLN
jgi:hypothetical protein